MSVENAAGSILKRGVVLDNSKRYTEALVCYQEGLQILVDKIKVEVDSSKKVYLRSKIEEFMKRAECLKKMVADQKEAGTFHEQLHIEANSVGHSYKTLFGRFLDNEVNHVTIEDPYIRSFHQCQNFLRLCELLVKSCENLKEVYLVTSHETNGDDRSSSQEQEKWFDLLTADLRKRNIGLFVNFSPTLHDRQITLSSGWVIKIGRGLDMYKPPENKFTLGIYDLEFRPCHQTTVDIFHNKDVKQISS
ncbi:MIT domain-containing protein 1-like [Arctopsyche grandis]|uniref:MIT domain-containing protein 1-like n=1 Tax=Arctopsyche grandis TaxID=121162 RepID=UPI00406D647A